MYPGGVEGSETLVVVVEVANTKCQPIRHDLDATSDFWLRSFYRICNIIMPFLLFFLHSKYRGLKNCTISETHDVYSSDNPQMEPEIRKLHQQSTPRPLLRLSKLHIDSSP